MTSRAMVRTPVAAAPPSGRRAERRLKLSDTVGTHLTGFAKDIAEQVTIHHLLSATSGLDTPDENVQHIFQSREEVHAYYEQSARQSKLVAAPGTPTDHAGAEVTIPALIVEAVTGETYWDCVQKYIFERCGMTGTAFYDRPQWLTNAHIAHPYMTLADGSQVDAIRNLDKGSPEPDVLGKNPGRSFIDAPGNGGFATAPDLVRFARAGRRHGARPALRRRLHRGQDPARSGIIPGVHDPGAHRQQPVGVLACRCQPRCRRQLEHLPVHRLGRRHPQQLRRRAAAGDEPAGGAGRFRESAQRIGWWLTRRNGNFPGPP